MKIMTTILFMAYVFSLQLGGEKAALKPENLRPDIPPYAAADSIKNNSAENFSTDLTKAKTGTILQQVPFTSQAPTGNWGDLRQEDGCEEASALMAVAWAKGETDIGTAAELANKIITISDFEKEKYGVWMDTSAADTLSNIIRGYFNHNSADVRSFSDAADLIAELEAGHLLILPVNGRALDNPNFTPPGPLHHMIVIKGYDYNTDEFITNDPGTRKGEGYRYTAQTIMEAARDYPTGNDVLLSTTIEGDAKKMIRVWRDI